MSEIHLPYHWTPRLYQRAVWRYLSEGGTRACLNWHRRSGKDEVFLHHMACAAHERVGNYWYMLPEYAQARKSMWDAINSHTGKKRIDEAFPDALRETTRDQEMMIRFRNGSTFQLVGSDNFNSLVGSPPVGLVFSEYALSNPAAWGYLRPILLENGGWAGFNSTPRGNNHFKSLCEVAQTEPGWFYQEQTVRETQVFTDEQLQTERREMQAEHGEQYGKSLWLQEYFCSFDAAVPGSIWGDCLDRMQAEGRICDFDLGTRPVVDTGWDLGRTDDTAIWFRQILGRDVNIVDHHSSNLKDIDFYVDLLLKKRAQSGWTYGTHWLPHDARPRTLAAGGKSILQQFQDAAKRCPELGRFAIAPRLDRQEGIQAARKTFLYARFHRTRCAEGLESLRHYHREWDPEKKIFLDNPVHDWASHDADAWRTLSTTWKFSKAAKPESVIEDLKAPQGFRGPTIGTYIKQHLAKQRLAREWASL